MSRGPTNAQVRALQGVNDREVALDRWGTLAYDGKEISGSALAACRRRGWTYVARESGPHGRVALSQEGFEALQLAGETCPTCGRPVKVHHGGEGTSYYLPVVEDSRLQELLEWTSKQAADWHLDPAASNAYFIVAGRIRSQLQANEEKGGEG